MTPSYETIDALIQEVFGVPDVVNGYTVDAGNLHAFAARVLGMFRESPNRQGVVECGLRAAKEFLMSLLIQTGRIQCWMDNQTDHRDYSEPVILRFYNQKKGLIINVWFEPDGQDLYSAVLINQRQPAQPVITLCHDVWVYSAIPNILVHHLKSFFEDTP